MRRHRPAFVIALTLLAGTVQAAPWTYRGSLSDGGRPANGPYDIRLTLLDAAGKRGVIGPITFSDVPVTNGSFALDVDFGVDLSNAPAMKLRTEVGEHGANFVALGEPSAFDPKATLAGVCWDTQGNAGTNAATDFIGTTDAQALNFRVNGARRLVLDGADNTISGASVNVVAPDKEGQTIGGGGNPAAVCGPGLNQTCRNETSDDYATVSGGLGNRAAQIATVGGGGSNRATSNYATVGGGNNNSAAATYATVGGGANNTAAGAYATAVGGSQNCAGGDYSFAGGRSAGVRVGNGIGDGDCAPSSGDAGGDEGSFVWADASSVSSFNTSGPNQFAIRAAGGLRWAGTGVGSSTSPAFAHQVNTASNTCDGGSGANTRTYLSHPLLNDNPNAVLVITPNFGYRSTGVSPPLNAPFGIYYEDLGSGGCPAGRWVIYQLVSSAASPMSSGARFNAWVVIP